MAQVGECMTLYVTLLGGFAVERNGISITNFRTDKIRALLAYLVAEAERPHRREWLAALFWPETGDDVAKRNLRQSLHRLKSAIPGDDGWLEMTRQTVLLRAAAVGSDIGRFNHHLHAVETHTHSALHHCSTCLDHLTAAVELYRGDLLLGLTLKDAYGFEEWHAVERERLQQRALAALDLLANAREQQGAYDAALQLAQRQIALERWRESAHRQAMRLLMQLDRRAEALAQFEACRAALWDELGVEPEETTTALAATIRAATFVSAAPPPTVALHNFPTTLTPFIGRQEEIAALDNFLAHSRLVTVVGPGGMGKTRLAVALAHHLAQPASRFRDGITFVPLASVTTGAQLESAIAGALDVKLDGSRPILPQLGEWLASADTLLVLDNFEQLIPFAAVLGDLLDHTTRLRLLVTSRRPTLLLAEQQVPLGGLPLPDPAGPPNPDVPSLALFVQAARRMRPDFRVDDANWPALAAVCRAVDGMPLALVLAAAWVRLLSAEQIAAEIGRTLDFLTAGHADMPARHRSIRLIFDHSWQQLAPSQQQTLAQLACFHGYFTLDTLLDVTGQGIGAVAALLDNSLLARTEHGLFHLHELVRLFAAEKLAADPPLAQRTHGRHAHAFLTPVQAFGRDRSAERLAGVRRAIDDVRAAWQWAVDHDQRDLLAAALDGLAAFYDHAGLLQEGNERMAAATRLDDADLRRRARVAQADFLTKLSRYDDAARLAAAAIADAATPADAVPARLALGIVHELRGDYPAAIAEHESVLDHYRQAGNDAQIGQALAARARLHWRTGQFGVAIDAFREALAVERRRGNQSGIESNLGHLSIVYRETGRYAEALACVREALAIVEALGYQEGIARHTNNLGLVYWQLERREEALACYRKAAHIAESLGLTRGVVLCVSNMGVIHRELGQWDAAVACYQRAIDLSRQVGLQNPLVNTLGNLGNIYLDTGQFAQARHQYREAVGLAELLGMREPHARLLGALGELAWAEREYAAALPLLDRAIAMVRELDARYYLPQMLAVSAACLVQTGQPEAAQPRLAEARAVALEAGRQDPLHFIACTEVRLRHALGETAAALALIATGLVETTDAGKQGDWHYERWLLGGDSADAAAARRLYAQAVQQRPFFHFKRRLAHLAAA